MARHRREEMETGMVGQAAVRALVAAEMAILNADLIRVAAAVIGAAVFAENGMIAEREMTAVTVKISGKINDKTVALAVAREAKDKSASLETIAIADPRHAHLVIQRDRLGRKGVENAMEMNPRGMTPGTMTKNNFVKVSASSLGFPELRQTN